MQMWITGVRNEFDVIAQNAKVSMTIMVLVDSKYPQMKDGSQVSTFTQSDVISILSMHLLSPDFTSLVLTTHITEIFLVLSRKTVNSLIFSTIVKQKNTEAFRA